MSVLIFSTNPREKQPPAVGVASPKREKSARSGNVRPFTRERSEQQHRHPEPADGVVVPLKPRCRVPRALLDVRFETAVTHDEPFEAADGSWGSRIVRPDGGGWRILDYSHDKQTR